MTRSTVLNAKLWTTLAGMATAAAALTGCGNENNTNLSVTKDRIEMPTAETSGGIYARLSDQTDNEFSPIEITFLATGTTMVLREGAYFEILKDSKTHRFQGMNIMQGTGEPVMVRSVPGAVTQLSLNVDGILAINMPNPNPDEVNGSISIFNLYNGEFLHHLQPGDQMDIRIFDNKKGPVFIANPYSVERNIEQSYRVANSQFGIAPIDITDQGELIFQNRELKIEQFSKNEKTLGVTVGSIKESIEYGPGKFVVHNLHNGIHGPTEKFLEIREMETLPSDLERRGTALEKQQGSGLSIDPNPTPVEGDLTDEELEALINPPSNTKDTKGDTMGNNTNPALLRLLQGKTRAIA